MTLRDKVCQGLAAGRWFSPGTPVSSTNTAGLGLWRLTPLSVISWRSVLLEILKYC
jgi:hypothetical protein